MLKNKKFADSRWWDHPSVEQLNDNLKDLPKPQLNKEEQKKKYDFLKQLKQWSKHSD